MEKPQLVNFIANILEDSGFKVYKNFKTTQQLVDIYAVLPTSIGDFALVVSCKNYDKEWTVGIDVLKEMEMVGKNLKASKVCIITSSKFSEQATMYGEERHIKLVDRQGLIKLAKKYKAKKEEEEKAAKQETINNFYDYYPSNSSNDYDDYSEEYYDNYYDYEYDEDYSDDYIDYRDYSEYDDNRYRTQYLNKSYTAPKRLNRSLAKEQNRDLNNENTFSTPSKLFGLRKNKSSQSNPRNLGINMTSSHYSNHIQKQILRKPKSETIKKYLKNPIVDIFVVVVISYLLAFILGRLVKIPTGYLGLTELIVALILSYGLVFYSDRDHKDPLIKGTVIFFISLVVLMILIVIL